LSCVLREKMRQPSINEQVSGTQAERPFKFLLGPDAELSLDGRTMSSTNQIPEACGLRWHVGRSLWRVSMQACGTDSEGIDVEPVLHAVKLAVSTNRRAVNAERSFLT
jgi:hypothetical protein